MRKNKVLVVLLIAVMLAQSFAVTTFAAKVVENESSIPFVAIYKEGSYGEYLQTYSRATASDSMVPIDLSTFVGEGASIQDYEGKKNVLMTNETGYIEFVVDVPATGLYALGTTYYPVEGKGVTIERTITINGEIPYNEAKTAALDRLYTDDVDFSALPDKNADGIYESGYFVQDMDGNEIRQSSVEAPRWVENSYFKDSTGYYSGALQFYLEKGQTVIRLTSVREPLAIASLYLYGVADTISYSEFLAQNSDLVVNGDALVAKIQAEYPSSRSDAMLYATYDRTSPATQPASSSLIKINVLGGTNWQQPGQWVEYKVNVAQAGLYKIILRARQNQTSGMFVSRSITVNGETPVKEATQVRVGYSTSWQMITPTDEFGQELLFKFKEGENTIRITVTTGELTDIINAVDTVVTKLNADYRRILALTGAEPDLYRDYELDTEIPEVIADLQAQGDIIMSIYNRLLEILGERGQQTAILYNVVSTLYNMADDPDSIPKNFDAFKNHITNLGSWLLTMRQQPLEIDYLLVAEQGYQAPKAEKGFWASFTHNIVMFVSSFFSDSNNIGATAEGTYATEITVWTTTSRDRAQIKQRLIERSFIPEYEINVNLELVPGGALLPSILAGKGPDVVMGLDSTTLINYASRNALMALDNFENFKEVQERFCAEAFIPSSLEVYTDNSKTSTETRHYGLPETQGFPVMFYRTDILEDMGVNPPETWDEVYDLIAVMKKRYMDFAPPDFLTILYQNGGSLYKNNGQQINIDSETAIQSFITVTDFYTTYNCPKSYNFQNRFRFGEMPIGMSDYTFYNTLSVSAPEIRGLWSFAPVPGTVQEDGTVNRVTTTTVSSTVMLSGVSDQEKADAWKFMCWWTDTDAQADFGRELESLLGSAARYNTANREAAQRMPWTSDELSSLMEQWDNLVGYPEMVGGYYYTRYYSFAFNEVLDDYADPRETLLDYVQTINEEIKYKRQQLGLPYDE